MKSYLLALDEGTTSARSILFDRDMHIVCMAQHEITQYYPHPGWVEQDPMEIYANQYATMTECIAKSGILPSEIAAIGITNQRETTVVWDRRTGRPIAGAIVWQCRRTSDICQNLRELGHEEEIRAITGLPLDPYFSGSKLYWILENVPEARKRAEAGELLFGTIDTWLLWKLTDGRVHLTDRTNASRTMLCNLETGDWDDRLLSLFRIPRCMLPEIRSSSEIFATVPLMGAEIPVGGIAGDQQAALFGQGCFRAGDVKNTYGTGCFLLAHTGGERIHSRHGLLATAAATAAGEPKEYALEGSVFVGGAVIQWLRDELRMITESQDSEYFARKVPDSGGVYVVPAFSGLGAPYWDMQARGTIVGLSRGSGRNHIIRAALDAIAYQTDDVLRAMQAELGGTIHTLLADGGASSNRLLMQFQADISGMEVRRSDSPEATAAGAAGLAGLAVGFYQSREEIAAALPAGLTFVPTMNPDIRKEWLRGWHRAVRACRTFEEDGTGSL